MRPSLTPREVERALRKVSQLRALFRRLPHVPPPHEAERVAAFQAFLRGSRSDLSRVAAHAGVRAAWRAGAYADILAVLERLPRSEWDFDRTLQTFAALAQEALHLRA